MNIKTFATCLIVAVVTSTTSGVVSAKQSRVIELVPKDGGSAIATVRVSAESVLLEFDNKQIESPGSDSRFQVPAGYKKLDN